ncbi:RNA binding protein [Striga asiatica]|uniref:RNA binding protein n=1 Tax=Striga asiatica TaxID=4170 RepID=A0A5A7R5H9_STRAF|nr:RNA binding protein [Striga asiatica]
MVVQGLRAEPLFRGLTTLHPQLPPLAAFFPAKLTPRNIFLPISTSFSSALSTAVRAQTSSTLSSSTIPFGDNGSGYGNRHWMVLVEDPPQEITAKSEVIDYFVRKLETVLGRIDDITQLVNVIAAVFAVLSCETDAQRCMYDASCDTHFGFCCDIDEETAQALAKLILVKNSYFWCIVGVPGVLTVKPDPDLDSTQKDYSLPKFELTAELTNSPFNGRTLLFPAGTTKHWLVRMNRPAIGAIRKAQIVDYYVQVLMRVLRNEKDAQMCMYHVSWESNYGFCCELDDECARELLDILVVAAVPAVLSVEQDENFGSDIKDYGGESFRASEESSASNLTSNIKTKKLFVTGLSFYTSEKTLRAAFEGFGELVEVKVIMDKISKRSKGYAFLEYTTEEAASTALREMNGKIINGWMITVDVAKKNPPKFSRGQLRPATS